MKKIVLALVFVLTGVPLAALGAERQDRSATLIDNAGTAWEITDVFIYSKPGGFYESRFCFTVITDTFHVASPPENLISVEVKGENCEVIYQWMGKRRNIAGKVASKLIGGKSSVGNVTREFHNVRNLTFKHDPAVMKLEKPLPFDTTLVLTDGTKVPVAKLLRVSSQDYLAIPSSGIDKGTVFDLYNDVGFFRGETAPTIKFEDVKSMEFPNENTITLRLRQGVKDTPNKGRSDTRKKGVSDDDFLVRALDDLEKEKGQAGKPLRKNWAYGFTGIYSKGYFFIPGRQVKAIEFGADQR